MKFLTANETYTTIDDKLLIQNEQELPDDFFNDLKEAKADFKMRLDGYTPVADIPQALVDKWIREGFDFWKAPAQEIINKLRKEEYSAFVVSGDRTF